VDKAEVAAGEAELARLRERLEQNRNDYDAKKEVLEHLKKLMRKLDQLRMESSWPVLQAEMKELYDKLVNANAELGNPQTTLLVQNLKDRMDRVIAEKNVRVAKGVKEEMDHLFFKLTEIYQLMGVIQYYSESFRSIHWKDAAKANALLERGRAVIASGPTVEKLLPICRELWALTPSDERPMNTGGLLTD
jgi:molecular chaperone DnaK